MYTCIVIPSNLNKHDIKFIYFISYQNKSTFNVPNRKVMFLLKLNKIYTKTNKNNIIYN